MFVYKLIPASILSRQARKPSGFIGQYIMSNFFKIGNADLNKFIKENLDLIASDDVLEIGFGPGLLIYDMAQITTAGHINGIDFSETMLNQAVKKNKQFIKNQKVTLQKADCASLPFNDKHFDKICSANTLYFWEQPQINLREIYRVLKPGGKLVIGFRDNLQMDSLNLSKDVFTTYSQNEVMELLSRAGFSNPQITEKEGIPFVSYCATATK